MYHVSQYRLHNLFCLDGCLFNVECGEKEFVGSNFDECSIEYQCTSIPECIIETTTTTTTVTTTTSQLPPPDGDDCQGGTCDCGPHGSMCNKGELCGTKFQFCSNGVLYEGCTECQQGQG